METPAIYQTTPKELDAFVMLLNNEPEKKHVKINKLAKNSKYLPINIIERKLDEYTFGLWQTKNFKSEVVANEIIGSIELKFFHPVAKMWITRIGVASTMILTASGMPATVENKIKNTLVKDYPHLKAECIKNAAKSIGIAFGRNLNRDDDGEFEGIIEKAQNMAEADEKKDALTLAYEKIDADNNIKNKQAAKAKISKYSLNKIMNYVQN